MNARFRATMAHQRPDHSDHPGHDLATQVPLDLDHPRPTCPTCGGPLNFFRVSCDGHQFETGRCRDHGDVGGAHG